MSQHTKSPRRISRRESLKVCLVPAGAIAGGWLIGCSKDGNAMNGQLAGAADMPPAAGTNAGVAGNMNVAGAAAGASGARASAAAGATAAGTGAATSAGTGGSATATNGGAGAAAGSSAGAAGAAGAAAGAPAVAGAAAPAAGSGSLMMGWASGGTKSMMGGYPDPFMTAPTGAACNLYPTQTLGPCYMRMPAMREDISDGMSGLPLRLSFLVVRNGCTPIPNASVDIWHSGSSGIYSAYATGTICNPSTTNVMSETFCRGALLTDETGRVNFSTVFPGWYSGRSVHIHFTVRINGTEEVTSQLYFEDALTTEIQAQGDYKARGMRSTTNSNDSTFRSGGATPEQIIMATAKRPDGVLHAWKVLSIG
jgi:protocatechuate 3,4-dioxygenase beta subunit